MGNGPVNAAIGVNSNWISYEESGDPVTLAGNNWGGIAAQGQASRDFQAMFLELASLPWESLEVQLAGRVDRYSDFGTVFNPKVAFR